MTTPTEARALAKLATVAFSERVPGSFSTDNRETVEKALKALRSLADQVEKLQSALADIAYSDDMTLKIARAKADRVYKAGAREAT